MFLQLHNYCSLSKTLVILIILAVCVLLKYYLSVWPGRLAYKKLVTTQTVSQTYIAQLRKEMSSKSSHTTLAHRIVHLDLKGAPPKISHYNDLFRFLHYQNITGVLIEYEDMFPYWGHLLGNVPAFNAYSQNDIKTIVEAARKNNLEIIPLIQTFGHFEFLLKHKNFTELREVPTYPNVICPTHNKTMKIIQTMITQMVQLHPGIKYLHIGCDEVYELGKCNRCKSLLLEETWTSSQLFLHHVSQVVQYVNNTFPEITPLLWEDHFRTMTAEQIESSKIADIAEPVVWNYHPNVADYIAHDTWLTYSQVFKHVWIASAFKGATAPDSMFPDIKYHFENHVDWARIIDMYSSSVSFRGIMFTGWQRYDHFAVLCELLPVGVPSLIAALQYMQTYQTNQTQNIGYLLESIQCSGNYPLQVQDIPYDGIQCVFPGSPVLKIVSQLRSIVRRIYLLKTPTLRAWLSPVNVKYNASNPYLVLSATEGLNQIKSDLQRVEREFREAASPIYDRYTVDEWLATYWKPRVQWISELEATRDKLLASTDWPRRPFNINEQL